MTPEVLSMKSVASRTTRPTAERLFFPIMAMLIVAAVFLGFARTFFLAPLYQSHLPNALVALHGVVFSAWIAWFAVQANLVSAGRLDLHKRLGAAGAFLLALVILLGCLIMLEGLRRDASRSGLDQPRIFALNLIGFSIAVTLLVRGLQLRRNPPAHKRLMLLTPPRTFSPSQSAIHPHQSAKIMSAQPAVSSRAKSKHRAVSS